MANTDSQPLTLRRFLLVVATGVGAGFLSGLFGVGGGLVIVPALMGVLGMDQRRASATSLAAIIVTAAVGSGNYALHGEVSWAGAALLVVGALAGSQVGVWLLRRLPAPSLPWILIGFTVFVIVSQYLHVPTREGSVSLTPASCALMILVGLCAGILSGLVGVGGGSVIVPGMELAVGAGDLIARGTSLLVMIPTSIAGTVTNLRHRMVDLRVGLVVGVSAAAATPVGRLVATWVSPSVGAILFNVFLLSIIASTILKMRWARSNVKGRGLGSLSARARQGFGDVATKHEGTVSDLRRGRCVQRNARVGCLQIVVDAPPERELDDARRVHADAQLKVENTASAGSLQEILIAPGSRRPSLALNEAGIDAQIRRHLLTAPRAARNQLRRDAHALLAGHRLAYPLLVVVGGIVAGDRTLQQPVIALRVEQAFLVEAGILETVIDVRGDHEVVATVHEVQEVRVHLPRAGLVAQ
mgnify:CR=1 FL=1